MNTHNTQPGASQRQLTPLKHLLIICNNIQLSKILESVLDEQKRRGCLSASSTNVGKCDKKVIRHDCSSIIQYKKQNIVPNVRVNTNTIDYLLTQAKKTTKTYTPTHTTSIVNSNGTGYKHKMPEHNTLLKTQKQTIHNNKNVQDQAERQKQAREETEPYKKLINSLHEEALENFMIWRSLYLRLLLEGVK